MQGHELRDTIRGLGTRHAAVAAVMRHAARHPIANPAEPALAEITAEGARAAEALGASLQGFDRLRLFHSPVKRCAQTAECLARGAERAGLAAEVAGPRDALGIDYIVDLVEAGRLTKRHADHFVRLWFTGQVAETVIRPPRQVAAPMLELVATHLAEPVAGSRRLDLHVSHDWNIIILRELLLGVTHEEAGWLTFLDGVAFSADAAPGGDRRGGGRLWASYRGKRAVVAEG